MSTPTRYSFERCEKKYFVTPAQQQALLRGIEAHMKPDVYGNYSICNLYYDTPDYRLIRASIEKPAYKEKLRVRSYGVPQEQSRVFVELKKKYSGTVYKRRVSMEACMTAPFLAGLSPEAQTGQIAQEILWFQRFYQSEPRLFLAYDRMAFAGTENPELRLTFDRNIRWRTNELDLCLGDHGAPLLAPSQILMEVKLPGVCPMWLSSLLSELTVYPTTFSKYGFCYQKHLLPQAIRNRTFCIHPVYDHPNSLHSDKEARHSA